jgi:N-acetylmuramoyl-L-alanine amidase
MIKLKSSYLWLLDAGHGGMTFDGVYTTAPAKMFTHPAKGEEKAFTFHEGAWNRKVVTALVAELNKRSIDYKLIADHVRDTPLVQRVKNADHFYANDKRALYLSIHSNAGGGTGNEVFTSKGQTNSDKLVPFFTEAYKKHLPDMKFRSDHVDGDADKEADFYVLRKTDCPAILTETGFYDNRKEAEFLMSTQGIKATVDVHLAAILEIEKSRPIVY